MIVGESGVITFATHVWRGTTLRCSPHGCNRITCRGRPGPEPVPNSPAFGFPPNNVSVSVVIARDYLRCARPCPHGRSSTTISRGVRTLLAYVATLTSVTNFGVLWHPLYRERRTTALTRAEALCNAVQRRNDLRAPNRTQPWHLDWVALGAAWSRSGQHQASPRASSPVAGQLGVRMTLARIASPPRVLRRRYVLIWATTSAQGPRSRAHDKGYFAAAAVSGLRSAPVYRCGQRHHTTEPSAQRAPRHTYAGCSAHGVASANSGGLSDGPNTRTSTRYDPMARFARTG
jgi:hypothetical protein